MISASWPEAADHVAVMYAGRFAEAAPVAALFDDPQHPYTLGLMGSAPSLQRREGPLATIPGAVPPPRLYGEGCRFAPRCPFSIEACLAERPALATISAAHRVACIRAPIEQAVPYEAAFA